MFKVESKSILNYSAESSEIKSLAQRFKQASPFRHVVLDDFLDNEAAEILADVFDQEHFDDWFYYAHTNNHTLALKDRYNVNEQAKRIIETFASDQITTFLSKLSGIDNILADENFDGGSFMATKRGGHLNIHTDFLTHPLLPNLRRRLNLLLYLNKDWHENYGGSLELWNHDMTKNEAQIAPIYNRCVIFETSPHSFHGFPESLTCPEEMIRKCLGLYYYTRHDQPLPANPTFYRARPTDGRLRSVAIGFDNQLLSVYDSLKRRFKISDDFASRVMHFFSK